MDWSVIHVGMGLARQRFHPRRDPQLVGDAPGRRRGVLILLVEAADLDRLHDALVDRGYRVSHQQVLE